MNEVNENGQHDNYSFMAAYENDTIARTYDIDDYSALNSCETKQDVRVSDNI